MMHDCVFQFVNKLTLQRKCCWFNCEAGYDLTSSYHTSGQSCVEYVIQLMLLRWSVTDLAAPMPDTEFQHFVVLYLIQKTISSLIRNRTQDCSTISTLLLSWVQWTRTPLYVI